MDKKELLAWLQKIKQEEWDGLDLSKNYITTLPPEIGQLKNLSVMDLSQTGLVEVPPEIGSLTKLRILKLTTNQLTILPEEINQLTELITLDVSENKLTRLPAGLGNLSSLQNLQLSQNQLSSLPQEIVQLENLRTLILSNNEFSEFPLPLTKMLQLSELLTLDMAENHIQNLPTEIGQLENLKSLRLQSNQLTDLPRELVNLKNLRTLDLRGNPLSIPPEILERINEPKAILTSYFGNLKETRTAVKIDQENSIRRPLQEAKVIFVGQGSVGKTSLIQQIVHNTFDPQQTKTEGITINQWTIPSPSDDTSIKLNIWDFGGQEIMHATHQFFLTKRSLYLLVLDARLTQEENRVEYWLKIIQSFGGESPVLIVGNKIDQHPLDIDRSGLQKKYPNIVGILETSAATGAGIAALKAEIARQVDALPHIRDLLPETWFTIKAKLEELGKEKNFITQDEYLELCEASEIVEEVSKQTLLGFLHDLGVVLHFQDDPRLEALGILNPQWVTNGVYKILNSHELFQNQGKLTLPMLNNILNLPEYPKDKRLFIVDMMKKFELCYDIEPDKSFLIPDLLPKDEPFTGEWDQALAFQYRYNILPSSIITRFIVRMNAFVHKTVWRSGAVLKSGRNTALVKADTEDRKIFISVSGDENTRRDFLSAIRMEFEAIHKTLAKIEALEEVPHPEYPELVLDYLELIEFERQGIHEFPKKVGTQVVVCNVRDLLDGIRSSKEQTVKVFISYGHADKKFVQKLVSDLDGQNIEVWWDYDALKGGQNWQRGIQQGIKLCDFVLVVLTPKSVASEWVNKELTYANEYKKQIIPLLLESCERPISIIEKQYIDFERQSHKAAFKELTGVLTS